MAAPFVPRSVEPDFPIGMIALDIDGTLVDDDLVVAGSDGGRDPARLPAGHHRLSGDGPNDALGHHLCRTLGLTTPVIGYQGALIREMPTRPDHAGRLLLHRPLGAAAARDAVAWSRERGLDPHINHLERLVIRADDPRVDDYSAFLGTRATRVDDLATWIERPVTKIVAVGPPGLPMSRLAEARRDFVGRADVTVAHPRFLEFVAPSVSKGAAVRWMRVGTGSRSDGCSRSAIS